MSNHEEIEKRPIYKKWWFWVIIVVVLLGIGSTGARKNETINTATTDQKSNNKSETVSYQNNKQKVIIPDFNSMNKEDIKTWCDTNKIKSNITEEYSDTIEKGLFVSQSKTANSQIYEGDKITIIYSLGKEPTIEYKNALKKAETYSKTMHMSKKGIYKQLTSEYGENFPVDAAQYAIDNMKADWNANALEKAKTYQNTMNMSKQKVYSQLISEYGENFTKEEAQYAIDHLEE